MVISSPQWHEALQWRTEDNHDHQSHGGSSRDAVGIKCPIQNIYTQVGQVFGEKDHKCCRLHYITVEVKWK